MILLVKPSQLGTSQSGSPFIHRLWISLLVCLVVNVHSTQKDTVYLSKQVRDGKLVAVFVDPSRDSRFYRSLTNFSLGSHDSMSYATSLDLLRERGLRLGRVRNLLPWKTWVPLRLHQGTLVVYKPCDFLFHSQWSVNDSTVIEWTGEGPWALKLLWQKRISPQTYRLAYTGEAGRSEELTIHIIDPKKGIAVFQSATDSSDTTYTLVIAAKTIRSVPLIVNRCPAGKELEFDFPDLDAKKFLRPTTAPIQSPAAHPLRGEPQ